MANRKGFSVLFSKAIYNTESFVKDKENYLRFQPCLTRAGIYVCILMWNVIEIGKRIKH